MSATTGGHFLSLQYENEQCNDIVAADTQPDGAVDVA
jgi:hypothetical protein